MAKYGENYYKVEALAPHHKDIEIAKILSISRERVRQLRIKTVVKNLYGRRQCSKCGKWFEPKNTSRWTKFRSTCGCKRYHIK